MLTNDDIRIIARQQGKPAGVIDKDYALEWLLYGIYHKKSKIGNSLVFKGGTSIRKIFFPSTWRFSEDLDFTILSGTRPENIKSGFDEACSILEDESGMKYEAEINIPDAGNAVFGFIRFTGPIGMKNQIKINASRIEKMVNFPTQQTVTVGLSCLIFAGKQHLKKMACLCSVIKTARDEPIPSILQACFHSLR